MLFDLKELLICKLVLTVVYDYHCNYKIVDHKLFLKINVKESLLEYLGRGVWIMVHVLKNRDEFHLDLNWGRQSF